MVAGLLIRRWSAVRASLAMVVDLLLMHRLSVSSSFLPLVCLLLCHWSAVALPAGLSVGASLVCLLVHHWSICWCITGPSVRASLVYLLLCRWSVCSFVARPYVRVMSLVRLIIRLVVHRSSPIPLRWSVAGLSLVRLLVTRLLVLLLESWSVFRRWSICSSLIGPSTAVVVTGLTAGRFARSSLVHPFGSCHSCVCSSRGRSCV